MQSNSSQHPQAVERPALVSGDLLGYWVEWTSQSQGFEKTKRGTVFKIVRAGEDPDPGTLRVLGAGFGMPRNHDSVLVRVGNVAYWPKVSKLRVIQPNKVI